MTILRLSSASMHQRLSYEHVLYFGHDMARERTSTDLVARLLEGIGSSLVRLLMCAF